MDTADSWFIQRLRTLPRRRRLEDILLDRRLRELDVSSLVDHIARLEAELASRGASACSARGGRRFRSTGGRASFSRRTRFRPRSRQAACLRLLTWIGARARFSLLRSS